MVQLLRQAACPRRLINLRLTDLFWVVLFFPALGWGQPPGNDEYGDLEALQRRFADLAERVQPSVVAINTMSNGDDHHPWNQTIGHGTGMVLTRDGFILTNEHVVHGVDDIIVTLFNGSEYDAEIVGTDPRRDLAVIRIDHDGLLPVEFGQGTDVNVGHWALAIGNPFGLANSNGNLSLTVGVVASLGQNLTPWLDDRDNLDRYYGELIQTSTPINPGNSGGPLFDIHGRVIGIVVAVSIRTDVSDAFGFAIPMTDHTRRVVDSLMRGEEVEYGMLGVMLGRLRKEDYDQLGTREAFGARIVRPPEEGSAAEAAGLVVNDIIVEFDGVPIRSVDQLVGIVGATPVGEKVEMRFLRDGRPQTAQVTVGRRNVTQALSRHESEKDLGLDDLDPETTLFQWGGVLFAEPPPLERRTLLNRDERGLIVMNVRENGPAYRSGLCERDANGERTIIKRVNGLRVYNLQQFRRAVNREGDQTEIELGDGTRIVVKFSN